MRSFDARLSMKVGEVLSGKDQLGGGSLTMTLEDGRFSLAPLQLDIPGGSVDIALAYEPTEVDVAAEARARIDHLDYGVLARRNDPETDMGGRISLDVALKSRAKNFDDIMQNAKGHFDFAIWPEKFKSGVFDLWAVNLFSAVTSEVDKGSESRVNCAVVRFTMDDGLMSHEAILIDTSRMRVNGEAKVNFKTQEVYLGLDPRAKKPQFFSLETPIEVNGNFADFGVGVKPGGLVGTVFRFVTSPIHVPIRRLTQKELPAGGKDVCAAHTKRSPRRTREPR